MKCLPIRWFPAVLAVMWSGCAEKPPLPPGRAASQATAAAAVTEAQKAVSLITTYRRDRPEFLTDHETLRKDLDTLEVTATRVVQDDGTLEENRKRFFAALDTAIRRADEDARAGENEIAHARRAMCGISCGRFGELRNQTERPPLKKEKSATDFTD